LNAQRYFADVESPQVGFGFTINRGGKRSMELAIPQDMQCKPGVAFIPKPQTITLTKSIL
jgi:hypothetical protein